MFFYLISNFFNNKNECKSVVKIKIFLSLKPFEEFNIVNNTSNNNNNNNNNNRAGVSETTERN
jgi:hypothetical protein